MRKVYVKLRSNKGETIAEVLVGFLIVVVAIIMLASMILASTRLVDESRDDLEDYYTKGNLLTAAPEDEPNATVELKSGDNIIDSYEVTIHSNGLIGEREVTSYNAK